MDQETLARIGRPLMNCLRCGAPLAARAGKHPTVFVQGILPPPPAAPGVDPASAPQDSSPDQVRRLDLCAECWPLERSRIQALAEDPATPAPPPRIVGFWMTRRAAPKPKTARTRPSRPILLAWWDTCWAGPAKAALQAARRIAHASPEEPAPPLESTQRLRFIRTHLAALILMRHGALRWTATERASESLGSPEIIAFRRTATQTAVRVAAWLPANDEELDLLANEVDALLQGWLDNPGMAPLEDDSETSDPPVADESSVTASVVAMPTLPPDAMPLAEATVA